MEMPPVLVLEEGARINDGRPAFEVQNRRPRHGVRFQPVAEADLYPVLRGLACRLPGAANGLLAISEVSGPYGIADLVAVTSAKSNLTARLDAGVSPALSAQDCEIVAALYPRRSQTLDQLAQRLRRNPDKLRPRVTRLVGTGAVERDGRNRLTRHPALVPVGRIWALEAKRNDWRRALAQARRYGLWADAAAAVLHTLPSDPRRVVADARRLGVGLAHESQWLERPRIQRQDRTRRLLASEHVVAAIAGAP